MTQTKSDKSRGDTALKVSVLKPDEMVPDLISAWHNLVAKDRTFSSPFFHPQFTRTVAQVRQDVEVAVISRGDRVCSFFPFQRLPGNRGRAVGGRMSDFQAVIGPADLLPSADTLLRRIGLSTWDFNNLLVSQTAFQPFFSRVAETASIDMPKGWEVYLEEKGGNKFRYLLNSLRKGRKMEREIGPIRFEMQTANEGLLSTLFKMKSQQYRQMKVFDVFSYSWTMDLVKRIFNQHETDFGGVLSVLYAGDQLAALHFGMRTSTTLHSWFPVYDVTLAKYSPGVLLFFEIMKAAPKQGIERIDLGRTDEWKVHLMNCTQQVAEGSMDLRPICGPLNRGWRHTKEWLRGSPLYTRFQTPARVFSRVKNWMELR